jgi:hypothetical protein
LACHFFINFHQNILCKRIVFLNLLLFGLTICIIINFLFYNDLLFFKFLQKLISFLFLFS